MTFRPVLSEPLVSQSAADMKPDIAKAILSLPS
jgi:hypothetical protein